MLHHLIMLTSNPGALINGCGYLTGTTILLVFRKTVSLKKHLDHIDWMWVNVISI